MDSSKDPNASAMHGDNVMRVTQQPRLWLSPQGAVSPMHYDRSVSMLVQVMGKKRMIFFSPNHLDSLDPFGSEHMLARRCRSLLTSFNSNAGHSSQTSSSSISNSFDSSEIENSCFNVARSRDSSSSFRSNRRRDSDSEQRLHNEKENFVGSVCSGIAENRHNATEESMGSSSALPCLSDSRKRDLSEAGTYEEGSSVSGSTQSSGSSIESEMGSCSASLKENRGTDVAYQERDEAGITAYEVVLEEGDAVFFGPFWSHWTSSETVSASVTMRVGAD